ncbi:MAG: hypothetical protein JWQ09_5182 [Segetibacter sp.]|nr:hypothetical protein [Segetibacter sp.]
MSYNIASKPIIFLVVLFGFFSCEQKPKDKKSQLYIIKKMTLTKEVWTIYSKQDTIFHIKRLLSSDSGLILRSYDINTSEPEITKQTFIDTKTLANEREASLIKSQNSSFHWVPFKTAPTLFVQISWSTFKSDLEPWEKREAIMDKIVSALKLQGHADWTGCDVGPGGLNMLFEYEKIDYAVPAILEVLRKEGFDKKTIIGRRINIEPEDWFYEVIYPNNFSGVFKTM